MSLILVMGIRTPHCAKAPKDRRQLLAFRLTALQLVDEADDCSHDENLALPVYYSDAVARQLPRAISLPKAYLHGAEAALVAGCRWLPRPGEIHLGPSSYVGDA